MGGSYLEGLYWDPSIGEHVLPESTGILVLEISYGELILGTPLLRPFIGELLLGSLRIIVLEFILGKPLLGSFCWTIFWKVHSWKACIGIPVLEILAGSSFLGCFCWDAFTRELLIVIPILENSDGGADPWKASTGNLFLDSLEGGPCI